MLSFIPGCLKLPNIWWKYFLMSAFTTPVLLRILQLLCRRQYTVKTQLEITFTNYRPLLKLITYILQCLLFTEVIILFPNKGIGIIEFLMCLKLISYNYFPAYCSKILSLGALLFVVIKSLYLQPRTFHSATKYWKNFYHILITI